MSANEFDELLKSKMAGNGFAYDPEDYTAMARQLAATRRAKPSRTILLLLLSMAACIAFAVIISGITQRNEKTDSDTITKNDTKTIAAPSHILPKPVANTVASNNESLSRAKTKDSNNNVFKENKKTGSLIAKVNDGNEAPGKIIYSDQVKNIAIAPSSKVNIDGISIPQNKPFTSTKSDIEGLIQEEIEHNYNRKLNISLAGGVNYGSANQGYLLGASARKDLGRKLYVEGDIAYINSNPATGPSPRGASSFVNGVSNVSAPAPNNNLSALNYLQMSPVVGYHIHKKIALGLGPDFQRLLQNNTSSAATVYTPEADKIAPGLDFGFIGKTEYSVSKRLKAGFLYREGMNNFISNTNKYFERNYFQVQVKYSLLN